MELLLFLRIASLVGMVGIQSLPARPTGLSIFYAVVFGHYVIQVLYSPKQRTYLFQQPNLGNRLAALIGLFAFAQWTPFLPMPVYFGIHWVLSEVYAGEHSALSRLIQNLRLVIGVLIYVLCIHSLKQFRWIPWEVLAVGLGFSLAVLAVLAWREKRWGICAYEFLGGFFALTVPAYITFGLKESIFAHVIWWALYPLPKMRGSYRTLGTYSAISVVLTALFFAFTPLVGWAGLGLRDWNNLATLLGNIHITLSFALSTSNPAWINAFFQPKAENFTALKEAA